jgi:hypothetical protein
VKAHSCERNIHLNPPGDRQGIRLLNLRFALLCLLHFSFAFYYGGIIVEISVYVFAKKRKIAVLGFILATVSTYIINLLMIGIAWLSGSLFHSSFLGIPLTITLSLLLSTGITFI